jgi:hypothetical protein
VQKTTPSFKTLPTEQALSAGKALNNVANDHYLSGARSATAQQSRAHQEIPMKRRSFLRSAGTGAIAAMTVGAPLAQAAPLVKPLGRMPRIAFGGIASECSTYSNIRQVITDANILRGEALAANERFAFLKRYEMPFLPTLVAVFPSGGRWRGRPMRRSRPTISTG